MQETVYYQIEQNSISWPEGGLRIRQTQSSLVQTRQTQVNWQDKYNLLFVLNELFADNGRLPFKATWKDTVDNVIHQKETRALEHRLSIASAICFVLFKL